MSEALTQFLTELEAGTYDNNFAEIQATLDERREVLKDELRQRVREIFGEDSEIVDKRENIRPATDAQVIADSASRNPFIQKSQQGPQEPPQPAEPLSNLDSLEDQMSTEDQGPVIGRGGAIIGGMRSTDMN